MGALVDIKSPTPATKGLSQRAQNFLPENEDRECPIKNLELNLEYDTDSRWEDNLNIYTSEEKFLR